MTPDLGPLGLDAVAVSSAPGGDTSRAWRAELADGSSAFIKQEQPGAEDLEAAGLDWLRQCGATVPAVLAVAPGLLALSWVEATRASAAAAAALGETLARVHNSAAPAFGCPPPGSAGAATGWVGAVAVPFGNQPSWPEHYVIDRLAPTSALAESLGGLTNSMRHVIDDLCDALLTRPRQVAGAPTHPAPIHGDMWSGNVMWRGTDAVLVDPAACGGHPITDLAMLHLFGAPRLDETLVAYQRVRALPADWRERIPLHQVFPLLVHAVMFGADYGNRAAHAARTALRVR